MLGQMQFHLLHHVMCMPECYQGRNLVATDYKQYVVDTLLVEQYRKSENGRRWFSSKLNKEIIKRKLTDKRHQISPHRESKVGKLWNKYNDWYRKREKSI